MRSRMVSILMGAVLLTAMSGRSAGAGAPGVGFHAPVTLPGSDGGNEPSLAISQGGVRYASWQAPGEFASSPDGVSFANLGFPDENAVGDVTNAVDASGTAYALWLSGNDVESNAQTGCNYSQIGPFDKAWVSTGVPSGLQGVYTWTSHLAWTGVIDPVTKVGDNASKIFAAIALDQGG